MNINTKTMYNMLYYGSTLTISQKFMKKENFFQIICLLFSLGWGVEAVANWLIYSGHVYSNADLDPSFLSYLSTLIHKLFQIIHYK